MSLTLYGGARTRASMPRWYLEEKGIPYRWVELNLQAGEHREPAFTAINPFAKLPALEDDGLEAPGGGPLRLFESGAILLHLAERFGGEFNPDLVGGPEQAAARRALVAQWLLFANATLAVALFVPSNREREFPRLMGVLDGLLADGRPLVGAQWGAADCAVQSYLAYLPIFFPQIDLVPWPGVRAAIASAQASAAYQRAMGSR
ncbi:MAG: glutathione S-transferase [Cyanobium sp. PLM2.Bin73]|jgi:glutathione S-transferase|nr:MAG: glutathione S-transferase [Cyanobium sp. PLM2.Bin73]